MKKSLIVMALYSSYMCAGPIIAPMIDYDAQDQKEAQEVIKPVLELPQAKKPILTPPGVREGNYFANYELDGLIGRNFADSNSLVKDATTIGIHLNRYITEDIAIQFGYDRILNAHYRFAKLNRSLKSQRTMTKGCEPYNNTNQSENSDSNTQTQNNSDQSNSDTTNQNTNTQNDNSQSNTSDQTNNDAAGNSGNGNSGNNGGNTGTGNSGGNGDNGTNTDINTQTPQSVLGSIYKTNSTQKTDIDRFYINGVKEFHQLDKHFIPYAFAGLGYENVNDKNLGIKSQGFFNAGGGLKYALSDRFRIVSEAKAIKKFRDNDLDIVATVGLGILFGKHTIQNDIEPNTPKLTVEPKVKTTNEPIKEEKTKEQTKVINPVIIDEEEQEVKPVKIAQESSINSDKAYYIQLAFVTQESSLDNYIQKLDQIDLDFTIKEEQAHKLTGNAILVGPFANYEDAKEHIRSVKKIEKGAFIRKTAIN